MRAETTNTSTISQSLREYGRGLAGGLIFSLPLLYTMEVWWAGYIARPERLLGFLAFTFLLLLGYNRYAGLRHDADFMEVVIDSVEEFGLGIITAAGVLFLAGRISPAMSVDETLGKVVVAASLVAIGFSVGTAQLGAGEEEHQASGHGGGDRPDRGTVSQLTIAFCGAVLFAANVAPTEEIVVIAVETSPWKIIALMALSLVMAALILFFSNFTRAPRDRDSSSVVHGTARTYAVSLIAAAIILWFFGRYDGVSSAVACAETVVLGLPAALGASAGRLLLQP